MGREKKTALLLLVLAVLLAPLAAGLGYFGWKELELASASERSTCDVLGVSEGEGEGEWEPWVILVHTVAGARFEREDVAPAVGSASEANALVEGLGPGARVPCRYPAGKPSLVVYFERSDSRGQAMLAGAAILVLAMVVAFARARRRGAEKG